MRRRRFLGLALSTTGIGPAAAQNVEGRIVAELTRQGYSNISISRTLLGRVRILARRRGERREIVVNPLNGAILRDYTSRTAARDDDDDDRGGRGGGGRGGGRDDDDDDGGGGNDDDDDGGGDDDD